MDFSSLGLGLQEIIFHAINLVILIVVLWQLLYKPIKKIIAARQEKMREVTDLIPKLKADAENTKVEYEKLLLDTKAEAAKVAAEAEANAISKAANILEEARLKAEVLIANAHKESMVEKTRIQNDIKSRAADLVVDIAKKVIGREVKDADNKRYISECLDKWGEE